MPHSSSGLPHQRQPAREPASDVQRRGRERVHAVAVCTCHTIRGTDAGSRVGPDLTHVASRLMIAAGTLPNTREHLRRWIAEPQADQARQPHASHVSLDGASLDAVLTYLRSLR